MAKILIVDDDPSQRRMMTVMLTREDHVVIEAGDGIEGLRRFSNEAPALVICDIVMPDKEGIETIREMRALRADIPIIAISGWGTDLGLHYLGVAQKLGADAIISKPFRPAELVAQVNSLLNRSGG